MHLINELLWIFLDLVTMKIYRINTSEVSYSSRRRTYIWFQEEHNLFI